MHSLSSLLPFLLAASTVHGLRNNIQARATGVNGAAIAAAQAEMSQASAQAASAASAWSAAHPTTSMAGHLKPRQDQGEIAAAQAEFAQASAQAASAASAWSAANPTTTTMLQRRQGDPAAIAAADSGLAEASAKAASAAGDYTLDKSQSAARASAEAMFTSLASGIDPAATGTPTGPDACGPVIPDPLVPDTCNTFIQASTGGAATYNASCLNDGTGGTLDPSACEDVIAIMCDNQWQNPGQWVWATNEGCSLGSYLPKQQNDDGTPTGAMQKWPGQDECRVLIYGAMLSACASSGSNDYNVISVNLPVLPNNNQGGQQVNAGYGSYLISHVQARNASDSPSKAAANEIPVQSIISAASSQFIYAVSSQSAQLATMTEAAAKEAITDLANYASAVLAPKESSRGA